MKEIYAFLTGRGLLNEVVVISIFAVTGVFLLTSTNNLILNVAGALFMAAPVVRAIILARLDRRQSEGEPDS